MVEDKKNSEIEREYTIPLRREWHKAPRYKRANKAIKAIKEFLVRHMKIRDGDLKKIRIDRYLNEEIWFRGIRNPPSKIKVKAKRDGEIVRVELSELPVNLKFKKSREENRSKKTEEKIKPKQEPGEPLTTSPVVDHGKKEESLKEIKETEKKKAAVVEAGMKMEKAEAKKAKHETKKDKGPKHQRRMALQK